MKNYILLLALIFASNFCFAMQRQDISILSHEQFLAIVEAGEDQNYPNEIYYVPAVPRKLAEKYFFEKLHKHHKKLIQDEEGGWFSFGSAHGHWMDHKKSSDATALFIERYSKAIVAKAFALRSPQLVAEEVGSEFEQAIAAFNSDLKELTYVATGDRSKAQLTQAQWQEYWDKMKQTVANNIPVVEGGPLVIGDLEEARRMAQGEKRKAPTDTQQAKKEKKQ